MENQVHGLIKPIVIGVVISILSAFLLSKFNFDNKSENKDSLQTPKENSPSSSYLKGINVSGSYRGNALNKTYNQNANIRLIINQDKSGKVTGTVNVTGGELVGSGIITGFSDGYNIGFTSILSSDGMVITFQGVFLENVISGDYTVSVSEHLKSLGLVDQEGILKVSR